MPAAFAYAHRLISLAETERSDGSQVALVNQIAGSGWSRQVGGRVPPARSPRDDSPGSAAPPGIARADDGGDLRAGPVRMDQHGGEDR